MAETETCRRMLERSPEPLSTARDRLNWSIDDLFASPLLRVSLLRCRPDSLHHSCEKCAVDDQLVFVTSGAFVRHLGGESQLANAGKATFFKAGAPYRTSHLDAGGDQCLVFSFRDGALIEDLSGGFDAAFCGAVDPHIFGSALRIAAGLRNASIPALNVECLALALLQRSAHTRQATPVGAPARKLAREIEAALTAAPGSDWSLGRLGREFARSPAYLTRLFARVTGTPLHRYLVKLRISAAVARLAAGEEDIAALALELGFSSHAHFSNAFQTALGLSPSRYRSLAGARRADISARARRTRN